MIRYPQVSTCCAEYSGAAEDKIFPTVKKNGSGPKSLLPFFDYDMDPVSHLIREMQGAQDTCREYRIRDSRPYPF